MTSQIAPSTPPCNPCGLDSQERTGVVVLEGSAKQALETGRSRLKLAGLVFALAFSIIAARLVEVTALAQAHPLSLAGEPSGSAKLTGRADIVDRNGAVLATTLPTASLYANPRQVRDPEQAARQLAAAVQGLNVPRLAEKLSDDRSFVWIHRNLTPRQQSEVNALGIPGVYFKREARRVYPHGALVSHLVGLTDVDNNGIAGIESAFDELLRGSSEPLALSIDIRLQHIMAEELARSIDTFSAIGGTGLVLDVETGEIVSMVSLPSFDPADPGTEDQETLFNRASLGIYEMGSVFKIFTTAMALDNHAVQLGDKFDVSKPIRVSRFTIRDFKPKKHDLTVPEVFIYSSNIGTVQIAMAAGTAEQQRFLDSLGLLRPASIEIPEVGAPMLPKKWREINTMTISYGHGLAISPVQLVRAVGAMINGGELRPATLLRRRADEMVVGTRVISEDTSSVMRWLMRMVVQHGTGRKAEAEGYQIGGKTGTADKIAGRTYSHNARIASFVAAFPMDKPRYVVFAMVDEPKGTKETFGYATGGWVAAPVVRAVVERAAPLLGVLPRPTEESEGADVRLIPASLEGFELAAH